MTFNAIQPSVIPASVFYPVGAATFNGSTYLQRIVNELSIHAGTFSCWLNLTSGNSTNMCIFSAYVGPLNYDYFTITRNSSNKIDILLVSNGLSFEYSSNNTYTASSNWIHLMSSWDTNHPAGSKVANLYINGLSDLNIVSDSSAAFSTVGNNMVHKVGLDFNVTNGAIGTQFFSGSLCELYLTGTSFIDLSTLANRRKFLTATKRPAFFGLNGSLPTGSQPSIYLKGSGAGFNINSGSLSNYTTTGTLTTPTTTPSSP